jgi:hypothetical protein
MPRMAPRQASPPTHTHPKNMTFAGRMSIWTKPMECSWLRAQATSCSRIFCCWGGGRDLRSTSASVKSPRSVMMKGGRSSEPSSQKYIMGTNWGEMASE